MRKGSRPPTDFEREQQVFGNKNGEPQVDKKLRLIVFRFRYVRFRSTVFGALLLSCLKAVRFLTQTEPVTTSLPCFALFARAIGASSCLSILIYEILAFWITI